MRYLFFLLLSMVGAEAIVDFRPVTLENALARAKTENKLVFVDFFVTWCMPCKEMEAKTWKDPRVQKAIEENVIFVKVNCDEQPETARKYKIVAHPTLAFINAEGKIVDRMVGYISPDNFLKEFQDALNGKDALARAEEKWRAAGVNNPEARIEYAKTLELNERPDKALEQYIWCWDEGHKHQPAFAFARRTFLLAEWSRLARNFPPAREAMEARRAALIKQGEGASESAKSELKALQRFLEAPVAP